MTWNCFNGDMVATVFILYHYPLMVIPPSKGSSILESSWYFDHQVLGAFLVLLVLPLFILFAWSSLCLLAMRSLVYMFFQSFMSSNHHSKNLLLYHVLCTFYSSCLYGAPKTVKGATGCKGTLWRLKDGGGGVLRLRDVLMCPKKKNSQGKVHIASLKDEGKIFGLPKCAYAQEREREGAGCTPEGWKLKLRAFEVHPCAQEGSRRA